MGMPLNVALPGRRIFLIAIAVCFLNVSFGHTLKADVIVDFDFTGCSGDEMKCSW